MLLVGLRVILFGIKNLAGKISNLIFSYLVQDFYFLEILLYINLLYLNQCTISVVRRNDHQVKVWKFIVKMAENESQRKYDLRHNIGYFTIMGVLFLILGLIIAVQTRKHIEAERSRIPETRQLNELIVLLKESQGKKAELEKQLEKLRQQTQKLSKESLPPSLSSPQFQKLYQIAGLTPVKGAGILIKIDDEDNLQKSSNNGDFAKGSELLNNDGLIHSDDLLKIVNELKASGAKAIAINNQRLVTTSEIVTAGNNIMVNQSRLMPPFTIKAVGPEDTMKAALKMRGGIVEYLEVFGIKVIIESKSNINVPAYTGSIS